MSETKTAKFQRTEPAKLYYSDAEYVREMMIVHPFGPEMREHNARLESIAQRLELLDGY